MNLLASEINKNKYLINNYYVVNVVNFECRNCNRHGLGSKFTFAILLRLWKRHFTTLSLNWWCWEAVLNFSHTSISIKLKNQNKSFN